MNDTNVTNDNYIDSLISFDDNYIIEDFKTQNKYYNTPPFQPLKKTPSINEDFNLCKTESKTYNDLYLSSAVSMNYSEHENYLYKVKIGMIDYLVNNMMNMKYYIIRSTGVTVDLTNLKEIWKLITKNTRINNLDFKYIKKIVEKIRYLLYQVNIEIDYFNKLNFLITDRRYESNLLINKLENITTEMLYIIDNLLKKVNLINSLPKDFSINNLNNDYSTKSLDWLDQLIYIYKKNGGITPVKCKELFIYFKTEWDNIPKIHQEEINNIMIYVLGNNNLKNIEIVSKNLEDWIKRNFSILDINYKNNIII